MHPLDVTHICENRERNKKLPKMKNLNFFCSGDASWTYGRQVFLNPKEGRKIYSLCLHVHAKLQKELFKQQSLLHMLYVLILRYERKKKYWQGKIIYG